jgi:hypothetical protein
MELSEIKNEVDKLAAKIDVPEEYLPTYGYSEDFARPHIETDGIGLHYVIVERGQELQRDSTLDVAQLLYWIFESITFSMSTKYELENREANKDCRRLIFMHQENLLGQLNIKWQEKSNQEHQKILERYPYNDR